MPTFPPPGLVTDFCDHVLLHDLPDLPADRRRSTVEFTVRRVTGLPSPMKVAVGAVALVVGALGRILGTGRVVRVLATRPLPVLGEYVRLMRSLTYAYVWDTWPDTTHSGHPATPAMPVGGDREPAAVPTS
jgi:hypothetical protein